MNYNYRYRIEPDEAAEAELERHIDTCRQLYNHFLYELRNTDEYLSYTAMQNMLPDLKDWWDELNDVYSKVLQMVARRVSDNLDRLKDQKDNGRKVGMLTWKSPREYRSLTYNQSGFELKNTSDQTILSLSKIGGMLGVGHAEVTPAETALPTFTTGESSSRGCKVRRWNRKPHPHGANRVGGERVGWGSSPVTLIGTNW